MILMAADHNITCYNPNAYSPWTSFGLYNASNKSAFQSNVVYVLYMCNLDSQVVIFNKDKLTIYVKEQQTWCIEPDAQRAVFWIM